MPSGYFEIGLNYSFPCQCGDRVHHSFDLEVDLSKIDCFWVECTHCHRNHKLKVRILQYPAPEELKVLLDLMSKRAHLSESVKELMSKYYKVEVDPDSEPLIG